VNPAELPEKAMLPELLSTIVPPITPGLNVAE
jgi:hypothetical protein